LEDAGYADGDFDRAHSSVILGCSGGLGELGEHYVTRAELFARLAEPPPELLAALPEWTEDSFPGILPNVAAGRVANRFDLGGANFTLDAACASSLTAIDVAVTQLESGRCNLAIAGGVDTKLSPFGYLCFSKTPALTPQDRARPFDADSDGILLGEGVAMVVLKRLAEAEADGDRIYAVIKASASSSDGKALGLTAPRDEGQRRAFTRAYAKAGINPASIGLYEAHGTGTRLGDETEARSIGRFLVEHGAAPASCALGSHKALIGHTKAAAGVSALIKTALALHYRTLPPQPGIRTPLASLREPASPLALLQAPLPWLHGGETPRRAGVSAFGFGGANCHCVLEEYRGELQATPLGAAHWPCELVLLSAADEAGLARKIAELRERLNQSRAPLTALAAACAERADATQPWRLAVVVRDRDELAEALTEAERQLGARSDGALAPHIQLSRDAGERGALALLFPGQGAQSLDMAREVALYCEPLRAAFETADRVLAEHLPQPLSRFVFPRGLWSEEARAAASAALTATEIAQPALGCVEGGLLALLEALGLRADMAAGHSYGEYMALAAAGVLGLEDALRLSHQRGLAMAAAGGDGAMAAVSARREALIPLLAGTPVVLANHNAPEQCVLSGPRAALDALLERLAAQGVAVRPLAVSGAFHSPLMAASQAPLTQAIDAVPMAAPHLAVYSNINAQPYPEDPDAIRAQLAGHLLSSVEFVAQIEAMHAAGARTFLEVGPRTILSGLVARILGERPHRTIALDGQGGGLRGLLIALAALFAEGRSLDARALFTGRATGRGQEGIADTAQAQWLLGGGGIRRRDQAPRLLHPMRLSAAQPMQPTPSNMPTSPVSDNSPSPARPSAADLSAPPSPDAALAAWAAYQDTMRKFLDVQEQVMAQFLGGAEATPKRVPRPAQATPVEAASSREPTTPAQATPEQAAPSREPTAPTPAPEAPLDRDSLLAQLLAVVSDCTGYPPEMLGLDQALEADLGIDSIKRVEILAGIE
ncbi:MAG: acyltransferase domain-containing protein, partial [Chromatiaceae bacterium]|nr:acyltransferase domain-containing protein [Chromatiaceae bacterium]